MNPSNQPTLLPDQQSRFGDLKSPMFQPRPGWGGRLKAWFRESPAVPLIAALAVFGVGGYILVDQLRDGGDEGEIARTGDDARKPAVNGKDSRGYSFAARVGQGITHLARIAVKLHLQDHAGIRLVPEQKIYAEDYLKDLKGSRFLEIGEEITFTFSEVESAVDASLALTETQIKRLARYLPLAKDL